MASRVKRTVQRFIRRFNVQQASERGAIEYLLVLGVHGDQLEAIDSLREDELLGDFNKTTTRAIIPYMNIKNDPWARKVLNAYISYFEEYQRAIEWRKYLENRIDIFDIPAKDRNAESLEDRRLKRLVDGVIQILETPKELEPTTGMVPPILTPLRIAKIQDDISYMKELEIKMVRRLKTLSKIVLGEAFEKIDPNKTIVLNKPQLLVPIGSQKVPIETGTAPLTGDYREIP